MISKLFSYLQLMRASGLCTAMANILAAHLILFQGEFHWQGLLFLLGASAMLYSGAMVLNDWFDYDLDLQIQPHRPLPAGKIPRAHALTFGIMLFTAGVGLAALTGPEALFIALAITMLALLYNGAMQRTNGAAYLAGGCRYLNWMLGLSLLPLAGDSLAIPIPVLLCAIAINLLSQQEESAVKPSVVAIVMLSILLAGLSLFLLGASHSDSIFWPTLVLLSGCGLLLHNLWQTYRAFTPAQVKGSIRLLIQSMIPLDALLVWYLGPLWGAPIVLALLLPQKMLMKSMDIT